MNLCMQVDSRFTMDHVKNYSTMFGYVWKKAQTMLDMYNEVLKDQMLIKKHLISTPEFKQHLLQPCKCSFKQYPSKGDWLRYLPQGWSCAFQCPWNSLRKHSYTTPIHDHGIQHKNSQNSLQRLGLQFLNLLCLTRWTNKQVWYFHTYLYTQEAQSYQFYLHY